MRVLSASWKHQTDITKIKFSDEFKNSDWVVKLDVLSDLIGELESHYNEILRLDWEQRKSHIFVLEKHYAV
jgi:hypothetical protein